MIDEVFRPTVHAGYEVSNLGAVARLGRWVAAGRGKRWLPYQSLPGAVFNNGYRYVTLSSHKKVAVHRLVAEAFCDRPAEATCVNHKDGNKLNNAAANLEWVTVSENSAHAYRVLGMKGSCSGRFSGAHPTSKAVVSICMTTGEEVVYQSAMDAVRDGYRSDSISRACRGLIDYHAGKRWRFLHATAAARGVTVYAEAA